MWNSIFGKSYRKLSSLVDEDKLALDINQAEKNTSGEIKVYIEKRNPLMSTIDRAQWVFEDLQMQKTKNRNAVLIYVAFCHKEYAIFGDEGIFHKYSQDEWDHLSDEVRNHILTRGLQEALEYSIAEVGQWLSKNFPPDPDCSRNELPDEIVFGS